MNRILLGIALLLTAGFSGQSAGADATPPIVISPIYTQYFASTDASSPQGSYTAFYPDVATQVPYSVTNQWVKVTGATPSSVISIRWAMTDGIPGLKKVFADDESNGYTAAPTDMSGNYFRFVNDNKTGTLSGTTLVFVSSGPLSFYTKSNITDASGNVYEASKTLSFIVGQAI